MAAGGISQKAKAFSQGKAMSLAPSCRGTTKLPKAAHMGMMKRKIMMVPCMVKRLL